MSTEITKDEAVSWLQSGALGVGENHRDPSARELTKNLIEQGHVRILFLECDSSEQEVFNTAVSSRENSRIKKIVDDAGPQYFPEGMMTLGDLALVALAKNVPVHLIDTKMDKKTTKPNPSIRDANAAGLFNAAIAGAGPAGCLVLFGIAHLLRSRGRKFYDFDQKLLGELIDLGIVPFD